MFQSKETKQPEGRERGGGTVPPFVDFAQDLLVKEEKKEETKTT